MHSDPSFMFSLWRRLSSHTNFRPYSGNIKKNYFPGYFKVIYLKHQPSSRAKHNLFARSRPRGRFVSLRLFGCVWTTGSCSKPPHQPTRAHPPGQGSKITHNHPLRDEDVLAHMEVGLNWGGEADSWLCLQFLYSCGSGSRF